MTFIGHPLLLLLLLLLLHYVKIYTQVSVYIFMCVFYLYVRFFVLLPPLFVHILSNLFCLSVKNYYLPPNHNP